MNLWPTRDELEARYSKIQNTTQLMAFVKNIKQDLNERKEEVETDPKKARDKKLDGLLAALKESEKKQPKFLPDEIPEKEMLTQLEKILERWNALCFDPKNEITDIVLGTGDSAPGSKLLKPQDVTLIKSYLPKHLKNRSFKMTYQGSKDGKELYKIVEALKGRENTIIVYKSATYGKIFGGFMDKRWSDYSGYFISDQSFLFSVTNKKKFDRTGSGNNGYFDTGTYGPCFGGDLWVNPGGYSGYAGNSAYSWNAMDTVGNTSFNAEEYEIFELK